MTIKFPCGVCFKAVAKNHRSVNCDICNKWIHIRCNNIDKSTYEKLQNSSEKWYCSICLKNTFPFTGTGDEQLKLLHQGKTVDCIDSTLLELDNTSNTQFFKEIDGIAIHDENFIQNCSYYSPSEMNNINLPKKQYHFCI